MPALERNICEWMGEALKHGDDVATCARNVLARVKAAGLGEALLDAYGDRLIAEVWREYRDDDDDDDEDQNERDQWRANSRPTTSMGDSLNGIRQPAAAAHEVATSASNHATQAPRGVRWMDVKQLATEAALLECLYPVDGKWIRLGDLNKRQCRVLRRQYGAAAAAFGQLAASLAERQTVRQRWTAKELEDLVGNTLRPAVPARPISR